MHFFALLYFYLTNIIISTSQSEKWENYEKASFGMKYLSVKIKGNI